jgi:hypothetical protein
MQPECDLAALLQTEVSVARLSSYREAADADLLPAVSRYMWNTQLCEALFPAIHGVEVALRNTIDAHMTSVHGQAWFDKPGVLLIQEQADALAHVKKRLRQEKKSETHDRIVAELSFGFWTGMLGRTYERPIWQTAVASAFPQVPRHMRTRSALATRLNDIRSLRNRVSHHESIWRRPYLDKEYQVTVQTLQWFAPALHEAVCLIDRFPAIHAAGSLTLQPAVETLGKTWSP